MAVWPYERGRTYNRRADIHRLFGGQQQSGIITPAAHPLVIIITGKKGRQHGYEDRLREDGVFEYFGKGQVGPMKWDAGNRAVLQHSAAGESLLLFKELRKGRLQYEGEWVCQGYQERQAPDRKRQMRRAFVFELRPLDAVLGGSEIASEEVPIDELRKRALAALRTTQEPVPGRRNIYQRSNDVRAYVLARAGAHCEGCEEKAPFNRPDGSPYLEPHHLRRLSDGGPDDPRFVIGLCPTCHRRAHYSSDAADYNDALKAKMPTIEPAN